MNSIMDIINTISGKTFYFIPWNILFKVTNSVQGGPNLWLVTTAVWCRTISKAAVLSRLEKSPEWCIWGKMLYINAFLIVVVWIHMLGMDPYLALFVIFWNSINYEILRLQINLRVKFGLASSNFSISISLVKEILFSSLSSRQWLDSIW